MRIKPLKFRVKYKQNRSKCRETHEKKSEKGTTTRRGKKSIKCHSISSTWIICHVQYTDIFGWLNQVMCVCVCFLVHIEYMGNLSRHNLWVKHNSWYWQSNCIFLYAFRTVMSRYAYAYLFWHDHCVVIMCSIDCFSARLNANTPIIVWHSDWMYSLFLLYILFRE